MTVAISGVRLTLAANVLPQMAQLATQRGIGQPVQERVHHARHFGENRREDVPFERITIGRIDRNRWSGCSIYKPIPSLYTEQHKNYYRHTKRCFIITHKNKSGIPQHR